MHKAHSLTLHVDGMGAAVHIPDIISQNLNDNATVEYGVPNHDKYPTHLSWMSHGLDKTLETFAIEAMLDAIGVGGLCIVTASNPGVLLNMAKYDACGDITAGSVHRTYKYLAGVVFPRTITVDHRGDARLSIGIGIIKKTANDSIVVADNAALPTITVTSKRWTIGAATVGAVALSNYRRLEIDFGFRVESTGVESALEDQYIEIKRSEPMITLTGIDPTWMASAAVPFTGLACTHANTKFYLRKRDPDGAGFVANATAEHLKFTANGVAIPTQPTSSNADSFAETSIRLNCRKDSGGNAPIVYTGASAIT